MVVPAIGQRLDEGGAFTRARRLDRFADRCKDRGRIVAVNLVALQTIGRRTCRDPRRGHHICRRAGEPVLIVFTDDDQRQAPDRRHVHGFVKYAFVGSAVAEKGYGDRV